MGVSFFLLREAKRELAYRIPALRLVMFIDFFNLEASEILLFHYLASIIFLSYSERTCGKSFNHFHQERDWP
jgi:hypothetical protein